MPHEVFGDQRNPGFHFRPSYPINNPFNDNFETQQYEKIINYQFKSFIRHLHLLPFTFQFILTFKQLAYHYFKVICTRLCLGFINTIIIQLMSMKDSFRNSSKREQLINEQRKKLEQLRLQTQSQNTKLLKIQQKEREVETQYQNEKRNMEQTLAKLALQAQNFMNKQASTTQEFEAQKEQIFANDRKKQQYLKQKLELEAKNAGKRSDIEKYEEILAKKRVRLGQIRQQIKKHQIYEQFLKEVKSLSEDFNTGQFDQFSVMTILDRYFTMKKKKEELSEVSRKLEIEKDKKVKRIQNLKKESEGEVMKYNSRVKDLKASIDKYTQQNIQLSSELEGKLNENGEKQRQIGQIIFSIRGLYLSIVGEEKHPKTTLEMLEIIREERKKLKQYLQLFQKKSSEEKSKS